MAGCLGRLCRIRESGSVNLMVDSGVVRPAGRTKRKKCPHKGSIQISFLLTQSFLPHETMRMGI